MYYEINCPYIVDKRARDFLDELLIGFAEEGRIAVIWCILLLSSVDCFEVSVRLILGLAWSYMLKTFEGIGDIVEYGDVHGTVFVVPI